MRGVGRRRHGWGRDERADQRGILQLLDEAAANVVVNTLSLAVPDRPEFFAGLLTELVGLRARLGRPHWLLADEVHHLLPAEGKPLPDSISAQLQGSVIITVHPWSVSPAVLKSVPTIIAVGPHASQTIADFCRHMGATPPAPEAPPQSDQVLFWESGAARAKVLTVSLPKRLRLRHTRKYGTSSAAIWK